jgi:IS30 family transposase
LNSEERIIIELGALLIKSSREIAFVVGRHHSTVASEIHRGSPDKRFGYSRWIAEPGYRKRRLKGDPRSKIRSHLKRWICSKLKQQWSPEQIVGRAKLEGKHCVSIETLYRFVSQDKQAGGELWKKLRRCRKKRKPRFPRHTWRKTRPGVEKRPQEANERSRLGHFEGDLTEGARETGGAHLTLVDRKSRVVRIEHVKRKWSSEVHAATLRAVRRTRVASLTNDNGLEFSAFKKTSKAPRGPIFFTRPYASRKRGSIENMNGPIRQYFPKKAS